jgi:hypothetical protein
MESAIVEAGSWNWPTETRSRIPSVYETTPMESASAPGAESAIETATRGFVHHQLRGGSPANRCDNSLRVEGLERSQIRYPGGLDVPGDPDVDPLWKVRLALRPYVVYGYLCRRKHCLDIAAEIRSGIRMPVYYPSSRDN